MAGHYPTTYKTRSPRLVTHLEHAGVVKRLSYETWDYWSRPVPSFGRRAEWQTSPAASRRCL